MACYISSGASCDINYCVHNGHAAAGAANQAALAADWLCASINAEARGGYLGQYSHLATTAARNNNEEQECKATRHN